VPNIVCANFVKPDKRPRVAFLIGGATAYSDDSAENRDKRSLIRGSQQKNWIEAFGGIERDLFIAVGVWTKLTGVSNGDACERYVGDLGT